jgi:hypothetical protein
MSVVNGITIQGEYFILHDMEFVGCDFDQANVHVVNGAEATFVGCTYAHTLINANPSIEFKGEIAIYREYLVATGGKPYAPVQIKQSPHKPSRGVVRQLEEVFGAFSNVPYPCKCYSFDGALDEVIMHLNDAEEWSREQIADWLDSLDIDLTVKASK